jgi:hypothetical protein
MNPRKRQLVCVIGAFFGAGLIHSLLPAGSIWHRAAITGFVAATICFALAALLPHPPKP